MTNLCCLKNSSTFILNMACIKAFLHSGFTSILWICLLCPLVSCAIFLEAGPQNKTVVECDKVTLMCDVNNDNINTIYWTYLIGPGGRRYISSNDYIYPSTGFSVDPDNYKVIIDQSQQTYKLVIMTINLSMEAGIYECVYEKDNRSFSTVLESELNTEPSCDCQTRLKESCQIETDLKEVIQKATHLEVQSFAHFYETMRDEGKPKTCVHNRLMTSSRPDEKEQELKDTVAEQKTSNNSSSVAHWKVDPVDLYSRPLPRCPKNPITVQYLYDHSPSAGDSTKDEIHRHGEINKMPSLPHIASQGFGIEIKSEGGTGTSSETKGNSLQTVFAENVLNDEIIDCSGMIRTSPRSSRKDAMVNSEQCNEMYLEMIATPDDIYLEMKAK